MISNRPYWTRLEEVRPINAHITPTIKYGKVVGSIIVYTDYDGVEIYPCHNLIIKGKSRELLRHKSHTDSNRLPARYNLTGYVYSQISRVHETIVTTFSY